MNSATGDKNEFQTSEQQVDNSFGFDDDHFDLTDDALDFFNAFFDVDNNPDKSEASLDAMFSTDMPDKVNSDVPLLYSHEFQHSNCLLKYSTAFLPKYYKNQRKNLMCFPRCAVHGDYAVAKAQGLDHNVKGATFVTCALPVELDLKVDKEYAKRLDWKSLRVLGRIKRKTAADPGGSSPTPGSPDSDLSTEVDDVQNLKEGTELSSSTMLVLMNGCFAGAIHPTSANKAKVATGARVWKVSDLHLSRRRYHRTASRKDTWYAFETLLLQRSKPDRWTVVGLVESAPFQILSTKTLQRELAKATPGNRQARAKESAREPAREGNEKTAKRKKVRVFAAGVDHSSGMTQVMVDSTLNQLTKLLEKMRSATSTLESAWQAMPLEERSTFYHNEFANFQATMSGEQNRLLMVSQELQSLLRAMSPSGDGDKSDPFEPSSKPVDPFEPSSKREPQQSPSSYHPGANVTTSTQEGSPTIPEDVASQSPGDHLMDRLNQVPAARADRSIEVAADVPVTAKTVSKGNYFPKYSLAIAFMLWLPFFGGPFGAHQYYLGRKRVATFQLFTFGGFLVNWTIDLFRLPALVNAANKATDVEHPTYSHGVGFLDLFAAWLFSGVFGIHHILLGQKTKFVVSVLSFNSFFMGWFVDGYNLYSDLKKSKEVISSFREGEAVPVWYSPESQTYEYSLALRAWLPWGILGAHRFYLGHTKLAVAQLFTGCGLFIGFFFEGAALRNIVDQANLELKIPDAQVVDSREREIPVALV